MKYKKQLEDEKARARK